MFKVFCILMGFSMSHVIDSKEIKKPYYDYFRKLVQKKKNIKVKPILKPQVIIQTPKVIPPLKVRVLGITGEEASRVAIISFNGEQTLIEEGDSKVGVYRVIQIDSDQVVFMHIRASKRQVFKIQ